MSHGNGVAVITPPLTPCFHHWCAGQFCASAPDKELFHRGVLSTEGSHGESVGVELVRNDHEDGTTTGTVIDITFTDVSESGVAQHSVGLSPEAALRHAAAVAQAASLALLRR